MIKVLDHYIDPARVAHISPVYTSASYGVYRAYFEIVMYDLANKIEIWSSKDYQGAEWQTIGPLVAEKVKSARVQLVHDINEYQKNSPVRQKRR